MAKFGAEKIWHRFLNATANVGTNSRIVAQGQAQTVNGGCQWARGWLLSFLTASGWVLLCPGACGAQNAPATRADSDTEKNGIGPSNHGIIWHTSVMPSFAVPNFARPPPV